MLSLDWGLPTVFGIMAIPTLIAGLSIFVMGLVSARVLRLQAQA
jgi:hypothetical protein